MSLFIGSVSPWKLENRDKVEPSNTATLEKYKKRVGGTRHQWQVYFLPVVQMLMQRPTEALPPFSEGIIIIQYLVLPRNNYAK